MHRVAGTVQVTIGLHVNRIFYLLGVAAVVISLLPVRCQCSILPTLQQRVDSAAFLLGYCRQLGQAVFNSGAIQQLRRRVAVATGVLLGDIPCNGALCQRFAGGGRAHQGDPGALSADAYQVTHVDKRIEGLRLLWQAQFTQQLHGG